MANVKIDNLASEIMKGLTEYKDLATADMKMAVRKAGRTAKQDIQANAPKKTGAYSKSWTLNLWNLQYTLQRNISWHIFWKRDMPNEAVVGRRHSRTSHQQKKTQSNS